MKKKKEKLYYSIPNNIVFLLKDMWKWYPLLIMYLILQVALSVASPVLTMFLPKITLELVMQRAHAGRIVMVLGGLGLMIALSMALAQMADKGKYMMYNSMRSMYQVVLFKQSLSCDYDFIEKEQGQRKYTLAFESLINGDGCGLSKMTVGMVDMAVCILSFVIYSGILSTLQPAVLLLLIVLSSVNYFAAECAQKYQYRHRDENADAQKKLGYVKTVMNDVVAGKDIRLYHMEEWFCGTWKLLLDRITMWRQKVRNRYLMADMVGAFTLFLRDSIAYGYLILNVSSGRISAGDFVLYFAAVTEFSEFVKRIGKNLNILQAANIDMNDLRTFLERTDAPEPKDPVNIRSVVNTEIEFRHVTFAYEKDSEPVLNNVSFTVRPGEKLALVGVNGAGKTTLIKLMCGFYKPQKGEIRIGGVDSRRFRREDMFSLYAAVFQGVYMPPFTVAEDVSLRPLADTALGKVERCLKEAGVYDKIMEYPDGLKTIMGREIEEGAVLSGGQTQKLLMARALYKDAPILILDEPTAALDPIAESETYETFQKLSEDKTAIFISHRLASTRFCDRILLLEHGVIREEGTHEELLKKGGRYAEMFEIQSQYYKKEGGAEDGQAEV